MTNNHELHVVFGTGLGNQSDAKQQAERRKMTDRGEVTSPGTKKVCIVGASGKLEQYVAQHALDRGYEVVGACERG